MAARARKTAPTNRMAWKPTSPRSGMESTHLRTLGTVMLALTARIVSARTMIWGPGGRSCAKTPVAPSTTATASQTKPLMTTGREETGATGDVMVFTLFFLRPISILDVYTCIVNGDASLGLDLSELPHLPLRAVGSVFDRDPLRLDFGADPVCLGELPASASFASRCQALFHPARHFRIGAG